MPLITWLFPSRSRTVPAERALNITLRTLHLVGLGGLGAGFLYPAMDETWRLYLYLTLITGGGLSLLAIYINGIWLIQLRGQVILFKLLLLSLALYFPSLKVPLFWAVIILSGWIAHAPANTRYYSLYHRRRVESL